MTPTKKALLVAAMSAAAVGFSAVNASADIACTGEVCWHAHEKYTYPPEARVTIHEDSWKAGPSVKFREHTGRGYWAGETWKEW